MNLKLENIESEKTQELANLIRTYNRFNREPSKSEPLNIYAEDEMGNLMAGMVAETFGNWLEIEYLYVRDDLRGQGFGSKILEMAEKESKTRGCKYSFVNTFNFQAPNFYEKISIYRRAILLYKGVVIWSVDQKLGSFTMVIIMG